MSASFPKANILTGTACCSGVVGDENYRIKSIWLDGSSNSDYILNSKVDEFEHVRMFMNEEEVMLEMKHDRIVEPLDIDVDSLSLIMEF